jgi:hypothetical protein
LLQLQRVRGQEQNDIGHYGHLKQKSPPMAGGQSMIVIGRSVAPSLRMREHAPPKLGGAIRGGGVQTAHRAIC